MWATGVASRSSMDATWIINSCGLATAMRRDCHVDHTEWRTLSFGSLAWLAESCNSSMGQVTFVYFCDSRASQLKLLEGI